MKKGLPALTLTALLFTGSTVFAAPTAADVAAQTATASLTETDTTLPSGTAVRSREAQAAHEALVASYMGVGTQTNTAAAAAKTPSQTSSEDTASKNYVEAKEMFKTASLRHTSVTPDYRLFRGDTMSILAVGFPDGIGINSITVGLDGYVQLPYVGSVKMEGLTLDEAKAVLLDSLTQYLRIPDLSLVITSYGPRKVYVMGEVNKPGIQDMAIDNMNAYAALASAGGWARKGRSTRIQIMRVIDGTMYYRTLNMKAYTVKHDLTQNVEIEDGDILYVPRSNGIKFDTDVLPYVNAWALYKNLTD